MSDYKNRNWLYQKYTIENISTYQLAKTQDVTISTIRYYLIKFNIKIRNREQATNPDIKPFYRDKNWLFNQYINEKKSITEIAKICNVSKMPIFNYLKRFNIKIRNSSQGILERKRNQIKLGKKYFDLNWLKEKGKKFNIYEIAKMCNTNPNRIRGYACSHNIKIKEKKPELTDKGRKLISEAHKGSKNPRWNGGISEYSNHCKLKKNRTKLLKIKNYKCEDCGGFAKYTHHKNRDKSDHSIENLKVLCSKCHPKYHKGTKKESKYSRLYGMSIKEISSKTNLSVPTISNFFNKRKKSHPRTENEIRKCLNNKVSNI